MCRWRRLSVLAWLLIWLDGLKFDEVVVLESDGRSGGLALFYQKYLTLTASEVNPNFIDILIEARSRFTGFYGETTWREEAFLEGLY